MHRSEWFQRENRAQQKWLDARQQELAREEVLVSFRVLPDVMLQSAMSHMDKGLESVARAAEEIAGGFSRQREQRSSASSAVLNGAAYADLMQSVLDYKIAEEKTRAVRDQAQFIYGEDRKSELNAPAQRKAEKFADLTRVAKSVLDLKVNFHKSESPQERQRISEQIQRAQRHIANEENALLSDGGYMPSEQAAKSGLLQKFESAIGASVQRISNVLERAVNLRHRLSADFRAVNSANAATQPREISPNEAMFKESKPLTPERLASNQTAFRQTPAAPKPDNAAQFKSGAVEKPAAETAPKLAPAPQENAEEKANREKLQAFSEAYAQKREKSHGYMKAVEHDAKWSGIAKREWRIQQEEFAENAAKLLSEMGMDSFSASIAHEKELNKLVEGRAQRIESNQDLSLKLLEQTVNYYETGLKASQEANASLEGKERSYANQDWADRKTELAERAGRHLDSMGLDSIPSHLIERSDAAKKLNELAQNKILEDKRIAAEPPLSKDAMNKLENYAWMYEHQKSKYEEKREAASSEIERAKLFVEWDRKVDFISSGAARVLVESGASSFPKSQFSETKFSGIAEELGHHAEARIPGEKKKAELLASSSVSKQNQMKL